MNNTFITGNFRKRLKTLLQHNRIRQYWYKKNKFHIGARKFIDWETLHKSYSSIPSSKLRTITKWNTGFCGVGKQLVRYKYQKYANCPFCQAHTEDTTHILPCKHQQVQEVWDEQLNLLHQWLTDNDGDPMMIQQIIGRLRSWKRQEPLPQNNAHTFKLRTAITHQNRIG